MQKFIAPRGVNNSFHTSGYLWRPLTIESPTKASFALDNFNNNFNNNFFLNCVVVAVLPCFVRWVELSIVCHN